MKSSITFGLVSPLDSMSARTAFSSADPACCAPSGTQVAPTAKMATRKERVMPTPPLDKSPSISVFIGGRTLKPFACSATLESRLSLQNSKSLLQPANAFHEFYNGDTNGKKDHRKE